MSFNKLQSSLFKCLQCNVEWLEITIFLTALFRTALNDLRAMTEGVLLIFIELISFSNSCCTSYTLSDNFSDVIRLSILRRSILYGENDAMCRVRDRKWLNDRVCMCESRREWMKLYIQWKKYYCYCSHTWEGCLAAKNCLMEHLFAH